MRAVKSSREEDEKRGVGEEMCGNEATRRAVERRRAGESCGDEESKRTMARRRERKL